MKEDKQEYPEDVMPDPEETDEQVSFPQDVDLPKKADTKLDPEQLDYTVEEDPVKEAKK